MKIKTSTVKKHAITGVENIDPIVIIMEDFGPGQGRIIIECFGEAWSHYWSHMGENYDIAKFFSKASNDYLIGKLIRGNTDEPDFSQFAQHMRKKIIEQRRFNELSKEDAREYYDECADLTSDHEIQMCDWVSQIDPEWWYGIPNKPTSEYNYLDRIISVIKLALVDIMKVSA